MWNSRVFAYGAYGYFAPLSPLVSLFLYLHVWCAKYTCMVRSMLSMISPFRFPCGNVHFFCGVGYALAIGCAWASGRSEPISIPEPKDLSVRRLSCARRAGSIISQISAKTTKRCVFCFIRLRAIIYSFLLLLELYFYFVSGSCHFLLELWRFFFFASFLRPFVCFCVVFLFFVFEELLSHQPGRVTNGYEIGLKIFLFFVRFGLGWICALSYRIKRASDVIQQNMSSIMKVWYQFAQTYRMIALPNHLPFLTHAGYRGED